MKKFLLFAFLFFRAAIFAQMDTEHWFAPFAKAPQNDVTHAADYLYLSTDQTTPFNVEIYNNNTLINTVSIAKGSPGIVSMDRTLLCADYAAEKHTVITKGLYLKADKKFFAHYRFSVTNHAEIITSKGKAGVGKAFFVYTPYNFAKKDYANSTFGITATEDATTVVVDNFQNPFSLSNGDAVTPAKSYTISLNKGQSYVFEATSAADQWGLCGARILADKGIVVTNGAYNGVASNGSNNDIYMDQSSPVDRLSNKYIAVKGNGQLGINMETVAVMATEDNTNVYENGSATPINIAKKGQLIMLDNYVKGTPSNDAYNLGITSDKKVYAYQMLAGVNANGGVNSYASGGMNILPAIVCLLSDKIDEFANVDQIGNDTFDTRLNIITEAGATVSVNGTQITKNTGFGPFPVAGVPGWETYTLERQHGNISIQSTGAVTAGIAGGDGAVGYGGYFSGFDSNPVIAKSGSCTGGAATLSVDDSFDAYQWYIFDVATQQFTAIPGATSFNYSPTKAGIYYAHISKNTCGSVDSPPYTYLTCTVNTAVSRSVCAAFTITPKFSQSAQSVNITKTKILAAPSHGTAVVDVAGNITYTPTPGFAAGTTDTFSYYIEGSDTYPDSEIVTVNLSLQPFLLKDTTVTACTTNGVATYDLTTADVGAGAAKVYFYENLADAQANTIAAAIQNPAAYISAPKTIYAAATNDSGCSSYSSVKLDIYPVPSVDVSKYNTTLCDNDLDGSITVNLTDITASIVPNATNFDVVYTLAGTTTPITTYTFTQNTTINVEVKSKNGCPSAFGHLDFTFGNKVSLNSLSPISVCDSQLSGTADIDLSQYATQINAVATPSYYATAADAKNKTNAISASQKISANTSFYIRFESAADCPNIAEIQFLFKQPKKSDLKDIFICKNATTNLDAGTGFNSYLWSTGSATQNSGIVGVGDYWVDLGYNGCIYRQKVSVKAAENPVIKAINITGSSISVEVTGGLPPYQYSLDGGAYQSENTFTNLTRGRHTIIVKDAYNCDPVSKEFAMIMLYNAITPNGDGINDDLNYSDLSLKSNVVFKVFDRYGALIYDANGKNFRWDGKTSDGRLVPTAAYWYDISWTEPDTNVSVTYTGWVLVKNR